MGMKSEAASELLPGTLDMLILRALVRGADHGFGIARQLRTVSEEVVQVGEGSLYPALQRLLMNGLVEAEWRMSDNNRRARYYRLTPAGHTHMLAEAERFDRMVVAIQRIMQTA